MQRSVVGVPERTRLMWRVYLFEHGTAQPVGPPHLTECEAHAYAEWRADRRPDGEFLVRQALVLLN